MPLTPMPEPFERGHSEQTRSLEAFSRPELIDQELTQELDEIVDGGSATWLALHNKGSAVEGKFFQPSVQSNRSLVVFEPGMPGDSTKWFEEKFVAPLLKEGYAVYTLRHRGTRTDAGRNHDLVHCDSRVERGNETGRTVIGGEAESIEAIARGPKLALAALGEQYKSLKLIGHSSGAMHLAISLIESDPAIQARARNFLSLSGFIGDISATAPGFPRLKDYYDYCSQFLAMGDSDRNVQLAQGLFDEMRDRPLPDQTMITTVGSPDDEYIAPEAAQAFQAIQDRGLRITDQTQDKDHFPGDIHDLANLQPDTLIRLLNIYSPSHRHSITVANKKLPEDQATNSSKEGTNE